ncbi:MAG: sel1 repeat family protein [Alphaproteobacteria bacterium]|nr:sel1 repeat family protein [Alphaproteobacteria bacterium]
MITPSRHITSLVAGVTLLFSIAAGAAGEASADASAEEYERGFQALEAGKFDEALYYISLYAANGDPRAQYTMGVMHGKGAGVDQDDREALLWFLAAAESGHMLGQYAAGLAFDQGRGIDRDFDNAVHYLREAALNGHAAAPVQLGNVYFDKTNPDADHAKAHFWWTIAERRNAPGARQNLGKLARTISQADKQRAAAYLDSCAKATLRNCFPRTP